MLAITILLLNRGRITARELAEKFEVSIRTVYRDLDAINLAGIPIMSYPGNEGGYCLMENFKIDRQFLTLKDMSGIISALHGINITLDDKQLNNTMEKIKSLLPKNRTAEQNSSMEQIIIDVLPWGGGEKQKSNMKLIHKAIIDSTVIECLYTNNKRESIVRKIEPMTLVFKGYGWYLFGYCLIKDDYRIFRLTRMKQLRSLDTRFVRKSKLYTEILTHKKDSSNQISLILKFSKEVKIWVEDYFFEEEIFVKPDGAIIVETNLIDEQWIYPMLLSYGENVEVIEPESIRKEIIKKIKKIQSIYQT